MTKDVKHSEDCERFFLSLGKGFTIEALMEKKEIEKYCEDGLDEFINQFLPDMPTDGNADDFVRNYSLCLLHYYFILCDIKGAVREGNGDRLVTLHKLLLLHFKSIPGFNTYAIEMLISVVQNMVFLSPALGHQRLTGKALLERILKLTFLKRTETETLRK